MLHQRGHPYGVQPFPGDACLIEDASSLQFGAFQRTIVHLLSLPVSLAPSLSGDALKQTLVNFRKQASASCFLGSSTQREDCSEKRSGFGMAQVAGPMINGGE